MNNNFPHVSRRRGGWCRDSSGPLSWIKLKNTGTKNNVATVANRSLDDRTAQRSILLPPSPTPKDIGSIPMIIASAVISTGRNLVYPASSADSQGVFPACSRSFEKLTTRMLLAVATPMHMMAPVRAGTLIVVLVMNRNHTIPANAAGSAIRMMNGSSQDWKFTTISR